MTNTTYYPPVGFFFRVEFRDIPGLKNQDSFFQEVSGLSRELETESVKSGGENRFTAVHLLSVDFVSDAV